MKKNYAKLKRPLTIWSILHFLAMFAPHNKLRVFFHRLRGVKIGKNVRIAQTVFIEESRPWLVTLDNDVQIAPRATIVAHDSSHHCIDPKAPVLFGEVRVKDSAYIGAGAIILPGVTIGERSIIAAGSVVTNDIPDKVVVAGVPAHKIKTIEESLGQWRKKFHNRGFQ